jgi:hypothetical protein
VSGWFLPSREVFFFGEAEVVEIAGDFEVGREGGARTASTIMSRTTSPLPPRRRAKSPSAVPKSSTTRHVRVGVFTGVRIALGTQLT